VLGQHRQAGRGGLAAVEQQVDDRRVDLATPAGRELVGRELADLLVRERVVGRIGLGLRKQEAGVHGRREVVRERIRPVTRGGRIARAGGSVGRRWSHLPRPAGRGSPEVAQAEAAAEDRRHRPGRPASGPAAAPRDDR
jgi:hypothetical protein